MRRSPHYSKSSTAKALMTIDCLNIACICRGGCLYPPSLHLSRETGSGLSSTCLLILPFIYDDRNNIPEENATPPVLFNFSLLPSLLFFPPCCYFCVYIACAYAARTLSNVCFSWGCMKNQSRVVGLHSFSPACMIVFLYLVKHITVWGLFPLKMEIQLNTRVHKYRKEAFFIVILPRGTTIMDLKWSNHKMIEV